MFSAFKRTAILMLIGFAPAVFAAPPESFAPIIEPLMPAVVNISTSQKIAAQQNLPMFDFDGLPDNPQTRQFKQLFKQFGAQGGQQPAREVTSLGSGFVIAADGYVVTNNHVVGNADKITVIFHDDTRMPATIVGRDPKTDLALLKIKTDKKLAYVNFGDSTAARVGDWVIAVGNPYGLGGSVSAGIVSARGRNINAGPFDDFIQTDAAINRGNSGGPLFNTKGEVIGINSAIYSPTGGSVGIGFAVPSAMAKPVIDQLKQFGTIHRGWLGVKIQPVTEEIANSLGLDKPHGALVLDINKDSPAIAAGLQPGDVITAFDGKPIDEMRALPRAVADTKSGKKVELTVWRKGKSFPTTVTIGELPKDSQDADTGDDTPAKPGDTPAPDKSSLGLALSPLNDKTRQYFEVDGGVKSGVVVSDIDGTGLAARSGIQAGDVILDINQQPVAKPEEAKKAFEAAKKSGRDYVLLRVARDKDTVFVTVALK